MHRKQELFLIGNPRSGTSLLRIMLNCHRDITIPPECGFIQWWYNKYHDWPDKHSLDEFIADLKSSKKIETWQLDYDLLKNFLQNKNTTSYNELVFHVIDFYGISKSNSKDSKILGDKNNYYINHLKLLKEISPQAKFLLILRDPKDIFCSYKNITKLNTTSKYKPNLSKDINKFIQDWISNQTKILEFFTGLRKEQFAVRSYQNLILNTKIECNRICDFLKIDFDVQMLSYYLNNDEPKELLDWKKKTLKPLDKKSLGRYKQELTQKEAELIDDKTVNLFDNL